MSWNVSSFGRIASGFGHESTPGTAATGESSSGPRARHAPEARNAAVVDAFIDGGKQIKDVRMVTCSAIQACGSNAVAAEACVKELERAICRQTGRRVMPDALIFNALIKVYRASNDLAGAERCVDRMRALGIDPTESTYNSLISAFGNVKDLGRARAWFDRLIADPKAFPDCMTFGAMIWSCGVAADPGGGKLAERWFALMAAHRVTPDARVYDALMYAHGKSGDLTSAEECLDRMRDEHGIEPDVTSYNTMIKLCMHLRKKGEAMGWLERMRQAGLQPNPATWRALGRRVLVLPLTTPRPRP